MTRIALVSDLHIGNQSRLGGPLDRGMNLRCGLGLSVLERSIEMVSSMDVEILLVLGDLFDSMRPTPQMLASTADILERARSNGLRVYMFPGNHDSNTPTKGDHALGPLKYVSTVIDDPTVFSCGGAEIAIIPHFTGIATECLSDILSTIWGKHPIDYCGIDGIPQPKNAFRRCNIRVLTLHLGLSDRDFPQHLRDDPNSIDIDALRGICAQYGITHVFSGHWHSHRMISDEHLIMTQLGALVPNGWRDRDCVVGKISIFDTSLGDVSTVDVAGPRFVTIRGCDAIRSFIDSSTENFMAGSTVFLEGRVDSSEWVIAHDYLSAVAKQFGDGSVFLRWFIVLDNDSASSEARCGAESARTQTTLECALDEYVSTMLLPENIDRSDVLRLAKKYLGLS